MKKFPPEFKIILSMIIFGTIGIFVREITLPSGIIAMTRGFVGMLFLMPVLLIKKSDFDKGSLKKNAVSLFFSGIFLGVNWMLLFESYRYTTVAVSTLCYYLAPIFVILVSPFVFGEKLTLKRIICTIITFIGAVLVSGISGEGKRNISELKGVIFGLSAAVFYALVVVMNKKIKDIVPVQRTAVQLGVAALTMLPYVLFTSDFSSLNITPVSLILLAVVGIVHTGFAYTLYFGAIEKLKAQTSAILSYIDPALAIILSSVLLNEKIDLLTALGAVMILGSTLVCEVSRDKE